MRVRGARVATPPRRDAARRLVWCRVASHGIAATWQVGIEAVQLVMRLAKNEQRNTHESSAGHDAQERELQQRRNSASNLRALSNALGGEASNEGIRRNDEAAGGLCSRAIAFYHIPAVVFLLRFAAHILHVGVRAPQILRHRYDRLLRRRETGARVAGVYLADRQYHGAKGGQGARRAAGRRVRDHLPGFPGSAYHPMTTRWPPDDDPVTA